jgi:GNAT superfamily N-acetyltransferase
MAAHFFDDGYEEHAHLRDGAEVLLRPVRPSDKQLLREGFDKLSPESRYLRFFAPKHELSDDELRYLTEVDGERHFAIGALRCGADGVEEGLGVARFVQLEQEPGAAEAAIAVLDEMQGKGLGSLLFQRLVAAAAERGISRFRCEVLGSNQSMQDFMRAQAPDATLRWDHGVAIIELPLPTLEPAHDYGQPPRESGLYQLLSALARGALEWGDAMARLRWRGDDKPS